MSLTNVHGCNQSMFGARSGGSCWGIAFMFCKGALNANPVTAMKTILVDPSRAATAEALMQVQDGVHKLAEPKYAKGNDGKAVADLATEKGFANQNLVIQLRHDAIKKLASDHGMICVGTLSSFFEGGTESFVQHLIELCASAGTAAVQIDLQQPKGHAVAMHYAKNGFYFFDPNTGLWIESDIKEAAADLAKQFSGYTFTFGHMLLKA